MTTQEGFIVYLGGDGKAPLELARGLQKRLRDRSVAVELVEPQSNTLPPRLSSIDSAGVVIILVGPTSGELETQGSVQERVVHVWVGELPRSSAGTIPDLIIESTRPHEQALDRLVSVLVSRRAFSDDAPVYSEEEEERIVRRLADLGYI